VYISLVNLEFDPARPADESLSLRVTCTNRDQAARLKLSGEFGELEAEDIALIRARCLRKPTPTLRSPHRQGLQWRLISHLSLNHLSIVENGRDALQEILRLYNFSNDPVTRTQIEGIADVQSRSAISRVKSETGRLICARHGCNYRFRRRSATSVPVYSFSPRYLKDLWRSTVR
jgi:type VI secretion system protein ImpG